MSGLGKIQNIVRTTGESWFFDNDGLHLHSFNVVKLCVFVIPYSFPLQRLRIYA